MEIIRRSSHFNRTFRNPVMTLGNFDGVHLGHQRIFQQVRQKAREIGGSRSPIPSTPSGADAEAGAPPFLLLPIEERLRLIGEMGMDVVICAPFTPEFASQSAEEFIRDVLYAQIHVREVYVGHNTSFGRGREGSVAMLKDLGQRFGFVVEAVEAVQVGEESISSSRIRRLIRDGNMPGAAAMLGRYHLLLGQVIHGHGRGVRSWGSPRRT